MAKSIASLPEMVERLLRSRDLRDEPRRIELFEYVKTLPENWPDLLDDPKFEKQVKSNIFRIITTDLGAPSTHCSGKKEDELGIQRRQRKLGKGFRRRIYLR